MNATFVLFQFLIYLLIPIVKSDVFSTDSYTYGDLGVPVQRVVYETGLLVVAATNKIIIIQPESNDIINEYENGPFEDHPRCFPAPEPCNENRTLTDNPNQILFVDHYFRSKKPTVFACGTVKRGMCLAIAPESKIKNYLGSPANVTNFFLNQPPTIVHYQVVGEKVNRTVLFVAASNRHDAFLWPSFDSVPTLSARIATSKRFTVGNNTSRRYDFALYTKTSQVLLSEKTRESMSIKYIYTFSTDDHTYFLKTVFWKDSELNKTKLIRICRGDYSFKSLIELDLTGRASNDPDILDFSVATSAFYGPMKFSHFPNVTDGLWVSFTTSSPCFGHRTCNSSRIIPFPISVLDSYFEEAFQNCVKDGHRTRLDIYAGQASSVCLRDRNFYDRKHCESFDSPFFDREKFSFIYNSKSVVSPTIVGRCQSFHLCYMPSWRNVVSSMHVKQSPDGPLLFLGSHYSSSFKVLTIERNIMDSRLNFTQSGFQPSPILVNGSLITAIGNSWVRFHYDECRFFGTCYSCGMVNYLSIRECKWCENTQSCEEASSLKCESKNKTSVCKPIFSETRPDRGPIEGGTTIDILASDLIQGNDFSPLKRKIIENGMSCFKHNSQSVCVSVGNLSLLINYVENSHISLLTEAVEDEVRNLPIKLAVSSLVSAIDIVGTIDAGFFSFVKIQTTHVDPFFALPYGDNVITIVGNELDAGSDVEVTVIGQKAEIISRSKNMLKFKAPPCSLKQGQCDANVGQLSLKIDNFFTVLVSHFEYLVRPPALLYISPTTVLSESSEIELHGENLHTLLWISVQFGDRDKVNCTINGKTLAKCLTPDLGEFNGMLNLPIKIESNSPHLNLTGVDLKLSFIHPQIETIKNSPLLIENGIVLLNGSDLPANGDYFKFEFRAPHVENHENRSFSWCSTIKGDPMTNRVLICTVKPEFVNYASNLGPFPLFVHLGRRRINVGEVVFSRFDPTVIAREGSSSAILTAIVVIVVIIFGVGGWMLYIGLKKHWNISSHKRPPSIETTMNHPMISPTINYQSNDYEKTENASIPLIQYQTVNPTNKINDAILQDLIRDNIYYSYNLLTIGEKIGNGHFGTVYKGKLEGGVEVAIKMIKSGLILSNLSADQFLKEARTMKEFTHPNVLPLICVSIDDTGSPLIVTKYMAKGDLKSYLAREDEQFTLADMVDLGLQVARGMAYLHQMKYVHRDLAARNCMVSSEKVVKIADFGLTRDIYESGVYTSHTNDSKTSKYLPIRWYAIECIHHQVYSTHSDVWSYGVLLWEIFTRGALPYSEVTCELHEFLRKGYRLRQPKWCSDELYQVLLCCWQENPKSRPSFEDLQPMLEQALKKTSDMYLAVKTRQHELTFMPSRDYYNVMDNKQPGLASA